MNITIKKDKVILPIYQPYIEDYSHRYEVYWGGRASGKTRFVIQKLIIKSLKEKRMILLMRKETNKLRDSVWKELIEVLTQWHLISYYDINKTEFRITSKINGSEFKCLGLDDSEKIKGFANMSDVFMDEITAFTADDIELVDGTLRSVQYTLPLQIYFCFNPISKTNFVYHYFGFDTGITPPDTLIVHSTYLDNPFLNESYIKRMESMKERNPRRYRIEVLGEFASLDKLVYENWRVADLGDIAHIPGKLLIGLDFGFTNDPTAIVASLLDEENKRIYVFREWYGTNKTNQELSLIIEQLGFSKSIIVADAAEPKSIEELRRCGIARIRACKKGKDSIMNGIQKLQNYEIIINPACENVITELENYSWKKDKSTGEYINEPIDCFNHAMDALRYSLQCIENEVVLMDKADWGIW